MGGLADFLFLDLQPALDRFLDVHNGLLSGFPLGNAAGQAGALRHPESVFAPTDNGLSHGATISATAGRFKHRPTRNRYYAKAGHPNLIRVDFHGAKEVPTGTCHAVLKAAGLKGK